MAQMPTHSYCNEKMQIFAHFTKAIRKSSFHIQKKISNWFQSLYTSFHPFHQMKLVIVTSLLCLHLCFGAPFGESDKLAIQSKTIEFSKIFEQPSKEILGLFPKKKKDELIRLLNMDNEYCRRLIVEGAAKSVENMFDYQTMTVKLDIPTNAFDWSATRHALLWKRNYQKEFSKAEQFFKFKSKAIEGIYKEMNACLETLFIKSHDSASCVRFLMEYFSIDGCSPFYFQNA